MDPRRTDSCEPADLFLQIQPGTDVMLFNGMLHIMAWEGWLDNDFITQHTQGFEALKATVRDYTPFVVADACGITKDALLKATRLFAGMQHLNGSARTPTLSLYCQGLNQSSSGTAKNTALINLHLGRFHVPIGKIAPQKIIDLTPRLAKEVIVQQPVGLPDNFGQARQNPLIGDGVIKLRRFVAFGHFIQAAGDKAGRIPDFVGEVAIAGHFVQR